MDVKYTIAVFAAVILVPAAAAAEEPASAEKLGDTTLARIIDRPHTIAYAEVGALALPTAPITQKQESGTIGVLRGDVAVQTGIHILYRWNRDFALGAAAIFAPSPLTENHEYGGLRSLPRTHSRTYLFLGGEGRWIPFHSGFVEGWVGLSAGGIIVADRFSTDVGDDVPEILGQKQVTIRTEGLSLGAQGGVNYYLTEHWIAGVDLRAYTWFLPSTPRCSSIGDCASLSGTVEAFELGLTIGYRLAL